MAIKGILIGRNDKEEKLGQDVLRNRLSDKRWDVRFRHRFENLFNFYDFQKIPLLETI